MNSDPSFSLSVTPWGVMGEVCRALWQWWGRGILTQALMMQLQARIFAASVALERLMVRFRAGKAMRRSPRVVVVKATTEVVVAERVRVWPREFGWLLTMKTHHCAFYTQRLEAILAEPEMVALLQASPQAARLLRPVCRMLGVNPALLQPGFVKVVKARAPRVRAKRVPIDWGRIPLPRGVLSAARRAGFKPVR